MKIVVPLPYDVSSLAHGRNLRIVNLLRELNNHSDLCCVVADDQIAEGARAVLGTIPVASATEAGNTCEPITIRGSKRLCRSLQFFGCQPALMGAMVNYASNADVVLGFDLKSAVYLKAVADANGRRVRTVCDLIDDPWLTWKSLSASERFSHVGIKTAIAVRIIRRELLSTFDALMAVAPRDAASLAKATGRDVTVIPNGIHVQDVELPKTAREPMIAFTGAMDFPPNESAACYLVERVWPHVLRRLHHPVTQTTSASLEASTSLPQCALVGANPTPKVKRLTEHAGVQVTGWVEDVSSWLRRARVAVAPMVTGSGMKNKILEACAAGCPVVTTLLGAAGLPTGEENGIIVAETPRRMSEEVARLLEDEKASRIIGTQGREMVRHRFSWSSCAQKMLNILAETSRTTSWSPNQATVNSTDLDSPVSVLTEQPLRDEETLLHAAS